MEDILNQLKGNSSHVFSLYIHSNTFYTSQVAQDSFHQEYDVFKIF